jgi:hypothetical protein
VPFYGSEYQVAVAKGFNQAQSFSASAPEECGWIPPWARANLPSIMTLLGCILRLAAAVCGGYRRLPCHVTRNVVHHLSSRPRPRVWVVSGYGDSDRRANFEMY